MLDWNGLALAGISFVALGMPQLLDWIRPGSSFGLNASVMNGFDSPEEWYEMHRTFGRSIIAIGLYFLLLAAVATVAPSLPERLGWADLILALPLAPMILVPLARTQRRLLRKREIK